MSYKQTFINIHSVMGDYDKAGLKYKIPVMLGINTFGNNEYADFTELKSILMGGTTGSGKSVFAHSLICSLLMRFSPNELKILLIDMKRVEFSIYNGLPYLLTDCIVDSDVAVKWLGKILEEKKNSKAIQPFTLIVIDTNSDIMFSNYAKEFSELVNHIANEGLDLGIYIVMYDSRVGSEVFPPSFLKNFKTHICFNTSTKEASQLLINSDDGINLLGSGDMLLKTGSEELKRIQSPNITENEITSIVSSVKNIKLNS